jgi:hypothetical protein
MAEAQASGDVERARCTTLAAATELLERAAAAPDRRAPLTLVLGTEAPLKQTLLAFRGGVRLAEHDAPGPTMLQVLQGLGAAGGERGELSAGSGRPRADPFDSASVGELGGRCRPLDRGRDQIQLRETPGNLSGSGSETHQHLSPAGANCCQSLLLDPNATMVIDLHKRLFLLVIGRGE